MESKAFHVVITQEAERSLADSLDFYQRKLSAKSLVALKNRLLDRVASLSEGALYGQFEPTLEHLGLGHRRLVEGHFKIIYRIVSDKVYVIDFFDSRMSPDKVKTGNF